MFKVFKVDGQRATLHNIKTTNGLLYDNVIREQKKLQ